MERRRVVVVGAGFGGVGAASRLARLPVDVTIVDRRNHHVFQPLLYQVATAGLSPARFASDANGYAARGISETVRRNALETTPSAAKSNDIL